LDSSGNVVGSISGYAQYDVAGNVMKVIDPRSTPTNLIVTSQDFSDHFGAPDGEARANSGSTELNNAGQYSYAFPTSVTNALGHKAYTQFDYYLGRPVDSEDANGVISSGYFNDVLDRPTQVIRASNQGVDVKSQTSFTYDDVNHIITTASDQAAFNDNVLKNQIIYDGLGRTVESRQYESSTQYIAVRQTPFIVLQDPDSGSWISASQSSNPFRQGEQPVWSTAFADALGRTTKVRTPDNAIVRTAYSGSSVTVSDQTGKQRKTVSDALGRLKEVYEAPNDAVNYNYLTSYDYDVLGNLRHVYQGSQTRTFTYDSLSRLATAINPESGTINYQYDVNGNLTQKGDARGVITTFAAYDPLNRPTTKSYSDGTPTVSYAYDAVGVANSKGRLTSISSSVSTYNYTSYDALGHAKTGSETLGGQTYSLTYSYDLAGHVKSINYPSGRTVNYNYDGAGRLGDKDAQNLAFTGTLGDGTRRNYSTGIAYSPFGALSQEQFGTSTPIYNKLFYNIRGQLAEIREGLTPNNTSWQRGAIINHYSNGYGCWGASCNAADNNGNLMRQEHWIQDGNDDVQAIYTQQYEYDQLNRLKRVFDGTNWQQAYTYDRYGNRSINGGATWGQNINNMQAAVVANTITNRLYAPGETEANHPLINYDAAGNQIKDYYSDAVIDYNRTYDAENRMVSATKTTNQTSVYSYDAAGRRVIRNENGVVTWQAYGLGGELLAEYAANTAPGSPQKEYGYRNGQLLITATVASGWGSPPVLHDNPLLVGQTTIQSGHITELRDAINALRTHVGMAAYSWLTSAAPGDLIKADPILEMRMALDQALGPPSPAYTAGLAQSQPILAIHIQELRNRVLAAWQSGGGFDIRWLVSDQLGTPRMIFDQSGSLANMSRHDYLPFGEELFAGTGGRTAALGYTHNDGARQKFTGYEADAETGLNFAQARYQSSVQGRFTGVDPTMMSMDIDAPQSLNRYSYTENDPLNLVDPSGMFSEYDFQEGQGQPTVRVEDEPDYTGAIVYINVNVWQSSGRPLTELELVLNRPFRNLTENRLQRSGFNSDSSGVAAPLTAAGIASFFGEKYHVSGNSWRGLNGKYYPTRWGGNGATGGRSLATSTAKGFKLFGRAVFFAGALNSGYQAYQGNITKTKAALDIGFGAAGTIGGPYGFAANVVYSGYDMTVGIEHLAEDVPPGTFDNLRLPPAMKTGHPWW
jgi:RHS repeat-associated protein